jgi:hypothetical protein
MTLATLRSYALVVSVLCGSLAFGQGKFTVNGRMKVDGGSLEGARAVVYKDGVKERAITTGLAKFSLALDLGATYVISFEREGYVAKKISFDTHVPADAVANGFTPFDFAVALFKQYDDINIVVFNQPVGMIRYDQASGDFDYDTDYTKSIQSQLQEVVEQVERKQKEEAQAAVEQEKRKGEEARELARAQAEAEKKTQAEQRAQAEAEKKAAADQAAQVRAQAEAERVEKARLETARKEEEKRKAAVASVREEPKPKPPPAVQEEKPKPLPMRPAPVRNTLASKPVEGEDGRRTAPPVMAEEASRVEKARAHAAEEERPPVFVEEPVTYRTEDLLVETGKVTTVVKLETEGVVTEYRRVFHKWGGTYYFKNGKACTQMQYDQETRQEQLAGATPRGKLD